MVSRRSHWLLFGTVAALALVLDQATKILARASLPVDEGGYGLPVTVIENLWDWRLAYNTGAAFSLLGEADLGRIILTAIGLAAVGIILYMVRQTHSRLGLTALGLILGGCIGNLIDRIAFGKVTDFIVWHYHGTEWPVFNIADVALCIGVPLMLIELFRSPRSAEHHQDPHAARMPGSNS